MAELVMKYQQYAEYKDSGVEWLGEIPSHWEISSLKRCVDGCTNGIWGSEPQEDTDNTIVLRVADFDRNKLEISEEKLTLRNISLKEAESRLLKKGDLLIEKSGGGDKTLVGCVVLFDKDFEAVTSNFVAKMTPNIEYESRFLKYAFSLLYDGRVNYASIKQTTGIQNLDSEAYLMEKFVFPIKDEQTQIANFLDHETAQIDTLIEKQQTLITLLKEKRQAVISHAVTKGLNPDAPMKESGVEWLGEVPEHWEFIKFDYVINAVGDIDHYMPKSIDSGIPYVMTGDLRALVSEIDFDNCKQVAYSDYVKLSRKIKASKDDIIFARYATIGTLSYVDIDADFLVSYSCVTIKPNAERTSGRYLFRYLKSQAFLQAITMYINSNTQGNVGIDSLRNVKVIMPPLSEQEEIINFLNDEVMKIDRLLDKSKSAITLMQERRTALISAAVTGKIDVRGWRAVGVEA